MRKHQQDEFWQVSYQWMKACHIKSSRQFIETSLSTHPDYPSLASLADVLDAGGLAYQAVSTDHSYAAEFTYPLLAHIKKQDEEEAFVLLKEKSGWEDASTKDSWTGILVMPGQSRQWQHADNEAALKNDRQARATSWLAGTVLILLLGWAIYQNNPWYFNAFLVLAAGGLVISWLTFHTETGIQNRFVKQVCSAVNPYGGCDKVLKSRSAQGIAGITPAAASLAWFTTQVGIGIVAALTETESLKSVAVCLSIAGIAAAAWSLISQQFIVKQWCALCLSLCAVLILQAGLSLFGYSKGLLPALNPVLLYGAVFLFALFLLIQPVKRLLKSGTNQSQLKQQLNKWQQDVTVLKALWQQQPVTDTRPWPSDLQVGNGAAATQIVIACSPYCRPCGKVHEKIEGVLERHGDNFGVTIRFAVNANLPGDKRTEAVKAILKACHGKTAEEKRAILHDWYRWMDMEQWSGKYPPGENIDVEALMKRNEQWTTASGIAGTPTIFINGRQVPSRYEANDVALLLPQLAGSFSA